MPTANPLAWKDEYSVGVVEIDTQHKQLFSIINDLATLINTSPSKESIGTIVNQILEYKKEHFATEEKYFEQFQYDGAAEHIRQHQLFTKTITSLVEKYKDDSLTFAFALVDYLEDWLISHLQTYDRKYVICFQEHGLH